MFVAQLAVVLTLLTVIVAILAIDFSPVILYYTLFCLTAVVAQSPVVVPQSPQLPAVVAWLAFYFRWKSWVYVKRD